MFHKFEKLVKGLPVFDWRNAPHPRRPPKKRFPPNKENLGNNWNIGTLYLYYYY